MPTAKLIALDQLTPADLGRWSDLAAAASEPNPFFEQEFLLPVARAIPGRGQALAVVEREDRWDACLPVHRPRRWHRVPASGIVTLRTPYTFLGSPLVRGEADTAEMISALIDLGLAAASFVGLDLLSGEGAGEAACRDPERSPIVLRRWQRATLHRRDDGDYIGFKPKHRREIQRLGRRLAEDLGEQPRVVDRAGDPHAADDFMALERSGWKGRAGTSMAQLPGHDEFFRDLCAAFSKLGRLQLFALEAGDRPLAMKCNLRAGNAIFCFKIAFEDSLARYSPGMQLELANIEAFEDDPGVTLMDSCAEPNNQMINRLWPDRRELLTLAQPASGLGGHAAAAALRAGAWLRDRSTA